jgi:hypothetical protein
MKDFMCLFVISTLLFTAVPAFAVEPSAKAAADIAAQNQGKLDKILLNQLEILRQLDEIKKELAIVKARATH